MSESITTFKEEPFVLWDILEIEITHHLAPDLFSLLAFGATCKRIHSVCDLLVTTIPKIENPCADVSNQTLERFPNLISLHVENGLTDEAFARLSKLTSLSLGAKSKGISERIFSFVPLLKELEIDENGHYIIRSGRPNLVWSMDERELLWETTLNDYLPNLERLRIKNSHSPDLPLLAKRVKIEFVVEK